MFVSYSRESSAIDLSLVFRGATASRVVCIEDVKFRSYFSLLHILESVPQTHSECHHTSNSFWHTVAYYMITGLCHTVKEGSKHLCYAYITRKSLDYAEPAAARGLSLLWALQNTMNKSNWCSAFPRSPVGALRKDSFVCYKGTRRSVCVQVCLYVYASAGCILYSVCISHTVYVHW